MTATFILKEKFLPSYLIPESSFTCAFDFVTRAIRLLNRTFELVTCAFDQVTRSSELLIRKFELITRGFELITRRFALVTRTVKHANGEILTHYLYIRTRNS